MRNSASHQRRLSTVVSAVMLFFASSLLAEDSNSVWAGEDPNFVELSGTLLHNHVPMSEITDAQPYFSSNDAYTRRKGIDIVTSYDNESSSFKISRLPRHPLVLFFHYHIQGGRRTLPGNYRRLVRVDVNELTDWECSHFDVDMEYIIHTTSPWDSNAVEFYTYPKDPYPEQPNSLDFEWEPVPGANEYDVRICVYRDPNRYKYLGEILYTTVYENSFSVELPCSRPDEHYNATISAYNSDGEKIGQYMTTYRNGYGWDYRFKACPQSVERLNGGNP